MRPALLFLAALFTGNAVAAPTPAPPGNVKLGSSGGFNSEMTSDYRHIDLGSAKPLPHKNEVDDLQYDRVQNETPMESEVEAPPTVEVRPPPSAEVKLAAVKAKYEALIVTASARLELDPTDSWAPDDIRLAKLKLAFIAKYKTDLPALDERYGKEFSYDRRVLARAINVFLVQASRLSPGSQEPTFQMGRHALDTLEDRISSLIDGANDMYQLLTSWRHLMADVFPHVSTSEGEKEMYTEIKHLRKKLPGLTMDVQNSLREGIRILVVTYLTALGMRRDQVDRKIRELGLLHLWQSFVPWWNDVPTDYQTELKQMRGKIMKLLRSERTEA